MTDIHDERDRLLVGDHGDWSRSAGVAVQILPTGRPGQIKLAVDNLGPERLNRAEMARTLRAAVRQLEEGNSEGESDS